MEPMESIAEVSEEQLMQSMEEMLEQYGYFQAMIDNIILFIAAIYILYIVINSVIWYLSNKIVNKKFPFLKYGRNFALLFLIFTLPIIIIINVTTQYVFNIEEIEKAIPLYIFIAMILLYFMYISFAHISDMKKISELPKLLKKVFATGTTKAYILVPTFIVTTGIPSLTLYIISLLLEANFALLLLLIAVFVILMNLGRIIILTVVKNLK